MKFVCQNFSFAFCIRLFGRAVTMNPIVQIIACPMHFDFHHAITVTNSLIDSVNQRPSLATTSEAAVPEVEEAPADRVIFHCVNR